MSRESTVVSIKKSFRDLKVWHKARALALLTYRATEQFPKREHYGLAAQMRRCSVSIPSNIAEGAARQSDKDYAHFLVIARGSLAELTTQVMLACDLGYLTESEAHDLEMHCDEVSRMLAGLRSRLTTQD